MAKNVARQTSAILNRYLEHFPGDAARLTLLREQLDDGEEMFRKNFRGHLTAAGVVLNVGHTALLMVHHAAQDRWLQPGGHLEPGDDSLLAAAKREVIEETGLASVRQIELFGDPDMPLDIETHHIPANPKKGEPEHYHHDVRYLFEADPADLTPALEEVHAAEWVPLDDARIGDLRPVLNRLSQINNLGE